MLTLGLSTIFAVILVLGVGGLVGWLFGGRGAGALKVERDLHLANFKQAIVDLEGAVVERDAARLGLVRMEAEAEGFDARMAELREGKDALAAQFSEVGGK